VVEFLVMAVVLVLRPWGLMGKPQAASRNSAGPAEAPLRRPPTLFKLAGRGVAGLALLAAAGADRVVALHAGAG
jgi:branched-chain amino acid transport system permease protein